VAATAIPVALANKSDRVCMLPQTSMIERCLNIT